MIKIAEFVPAEIRTQAEAAKEGIKSGQIEVFTGSIVGSDGQERLAKDVKADPAWKDKVDVYVKGVEGRITSGGK